MSQKRQEGKGSRASVQMEAVGKFYQLQAKKYRYIIYRIEEDLNNGIREIRVAFTGPRDASYSDFLAKLQDYTNQCIFCVFDFRANIPVEGGGETRRVKKLLFIIWYHPSSPSNERMLYACSWKIFLDALGGDFLRVEAGEMGELTRDQIENRIQAAFREGGK